LSDADAASFYIAYATAWYGLVDRGGLTAGEWLVVLGAAGGTGAAAVQLGRALGAHVVAVVGDEPGDDRKARWCRSLGAERVIDHRAASVPDALRALRPDGVDAIYDPVGGAPAIDALGGLATGGRLLAIGFASGAGEQPSSRHVLRRNASIVGVFVGAYDRATNENTVARLGELATAGRIGGLVTDTFPFDRVPDALERVARREVTGRVVVIP
jgi:NADPH2:quinone reductase